MSLPDCRVVATQSRESTRRFLATWDRVERENREHARAVLVESMGLEYAILAAPHLFGYTQERGGRKAGSEKQRRVETRVLERLADLAQKGDLPQPRNLIATLTAAPGLRRDSTREALQRLAQAGKLPDVYTQHFLPK